MIKKKQTNIKQKNQTVKIILILFLAVFVCGAGYSAYKIITISSNYHVSDAEYEALNKDVVKPIPTSDETGKEEDSIYLDINYNELKQKNSDYVGWLQVPGTNISYPLVSGYDNDEYLHKTFEGQYAFAGSLFLDYRNHTDLTDYNTIIYGHHMNNNTMFAQLDLFWRESFGKTNKEFFIYKDDDIYVYDVYAFINTTSNSYAYTMYFEDEAAFASHLRKVKTEEYYDMELPPRTRSPIVTLSTCDGIDTGRRYALIGSLREILNVNDLKGN